MDELELKGYVQNVTKKFVPLFSSVTDPTERIRLLLEEPVPDKLLEKNFREHIKRDWPRKNEKLASRNRENGNVAFQNGNHEMAVVLYTEAIKYSPVDEALWEGESMAIAAANRSASNYQLKNFLACLTDIRLAVEAGYPTDIVYKLHIRKCKCLLELEKIAEAQTAFDDAIDAIDRSGLKKDSRKGMATNLQEAFINLAKSVEDNQLLAAAAAEPSDAKRWIPDWARLKDPHPLYPSASSSITVNYNSSFGRHVVANKKIEFGEVIFHERPIVSCLKSAVDAGDDGVAIPACQHCLRYITSSGLVPCPTCNVSAFCSVECRNEALASHHRYECRLSSFMEQTRLDELPLVMLALRAVAQKPLAFFTDDQNQRRAFGSHDVRNGVTDGGQDVKWVFESHDYRNLFNLVTHSDKRTVVDTVMKNVFATVLVRALKAAGYFDKASDEDQVLVGRLLAHFLECMQFNTHMVESVYSNRLIAPDSETRMWKDSNRFALGEYVETHQVGGGVYPTMANVNHSCDPSFNIYNIHGNVAVAVANRNIAKGEEIHDTYGAVYFHMNKTERQQYLKVSSGRHPSPSRVQQQFLSKASHWFTCSCRPCSQNWPIYTKLPRDYVRLAGSNFKYKRCNRKELQKDVDKLKRKLKAAIVDEDEQQFEAAEKLYKNWFHLLDELIWLPGHQDFVNIRRGLRNCLWMKSNATNVIKVKEDEALRLKKICYKD